MNNITFATCWYNMKSKFNKNTYKNWITNFLYNVDNFNLVIFTNKESFSFINEIINKNNTHIKIIIKEFEEFKTWNKRKNWIENHNNNNTLNFKSRWNTDWKLNMLWNEKISFVKYVKDINIFDTEWYGWCDIGYFRGGNGLTTQDIKHWPNNTKISALNNGKIYYGLPGNRSDLNKYVKMLIDKNEKGFPKQLIPIEQISIAGGFFLSNKEQIDWWYNIYYTRLYEYLDNNILVKDDQYIIIDCIANNLKKFSLIEEENAFKDRWFVFQNYLL